MANAPAWHIDRESIRLFALASSRNLGEKIAREFGITLAVHEETEFEDGEGKSRAVDSVRGKDVFVIDRSIAIPATVRALPLATVREYAAALRQP